MQTPFEQAEVDRILEQIDLYARTISQRIAELEDEPEKIHEKTELRSLVQTIYILRSMLREDTQYDARSKHRRFNLREFFDLAFTLGQMMPQTIYQKQIKQSGFVGHRYDNQRLSRWNGEKGRQKGGRTRNDEHFKIITAAGKILHRELTRQHGADLKITRARIVKALEAFDPRERHKWKELTPSDLKTMTRSFDVLYERNGDAARYTEKTLRDWLKESDIPPKKPPK